MKNTASFQHPSHNSTNSCCSTSTSSVGSESRTPISADCTSFPTGEPQPCLMLFLQQPFYPFLSHSLGKGQAKRWAFLGLLEPRAAEWVGCLLPAPSHPSGVIREDRHCQSGHVSLSHASIPAQLSDQVSASPELWQRTGTVCKQPRAVNKRERLHSIRIWARLLILVLLIQFLHHCTTQFEASEFFNGYC